MKEQYFKVVVEHTFYVRHNNLSEEDVVRHLRDAINQARYAISWATPED
jgi:hypothetical protein